MVFSTPFEVPCPDQREALRIVIDRGVTRCKQMLPHASTTLRSLLVAAAVLESALGAIQVPDDDVRDEIDTDPGEDGGEQI